jgi:hypothetical protein
VFVGDYFTLLKRGENLIDSKLMPIKVKYMSAEERKKWEIIEEQKRKYQEEQRKKKEYMETLQK